VCFEVFIAAAALPASGHQQALAVLVQLPCKNTVLISI
jgi:hypothetical protein